MQLFVKGIIDSTKATFRRWRRAIPQLFNLDGTPGYGTDAAISGDGTTICVYKLVTNNSSSNVANVIVYKILPDGSSVQLGQTFSHSGNPINFGAACALNFDGTWLAISSRFFNRTTGGGGTITGRVQIYNFSNNQWNLTGTILGISETSLYNDSIAFNNSGSRIGFYVGNVSTGTFSSIRYFRVYDFDGTQWTQVGDTLQSPTSFYFRDSISFNAQGNRVSTTNKIFELQSNSWVEIGDFPVIVTDTGPPFYYLQNNCPTVIKLNETGDKLAIAYVYRPSNSTYSNQTYIKLFHQISGSWVLKAEKSIENYLGKTVSSGGAVTQYVIVSNGYPKIAKDGNSILVSSTFVDQNQVVLPGNSSVVTSKCAIWNYNAATNQLEEDSQVIYSSKTPISASWALTDISKDGKTFVYGKHSDARIGSINQLQAYGVVDVFRKELD